MGRPWRLAEGAIAVATLVHSVRKARSCRVEPAEERVFRLINDAPDEAHLPSWLIMQGGTLAAVFVAAGRQFHRGNRRAARVSLVAGTAVWVGVKVVKPAIGRGRPAQHLDGVSVRGCPPSGLGYPSGHAAVAMTLALIDGRSLGPLGRVTGVATAGLTGVCRIYVGAHLPLDVAGGVAIGVLSGRLASAFLAVD